jgi:heat shock protein HtpX
MKRVLLFLATNLAVVAVLSIATQLLGIAPYLSERGISLPALIAFALVWGMGGSLISLALSKFMAKQATGSAVIAQPRTAAESWLVERVGQHARAAGIGMPEVAIYPSPVPNAFATGARRDRSLVAVSAGLLESMDRDEVDAVLAHEVSHVANGDMVTLALIQGVVNAFVIALSRVVGSFVDRALFRDDRGEGGYGIGYHLTVIACDILFGILAMIIVMRFSRSREFRADAGSARLVGPGKMIAALERLRLLSDTAPLPGQLRAFGIAGGERRGLARLLASHPSLEERIAALRALGG